MLIIVLNDLKHSYHLKKYEKFKLHINRQYEEKPNLTNEVNVLRIDISFKILRFFFIFKIGVTITSLHTEWPHLDGAWTVIPIIKEY